MAWNAPEGPLLDSSDSSLSLLVGGNKQEACTTSSEGLLGYTFGGIRSPLSLTSGRACFTCVILDATEVSARDTELLRTSYIARIGVSQSNTDVCRLGEVRGSKGISVGYNSTGKKVESSKFEPYGEPFGPRDHITVLVDLTGTQVDSVTGAPVGRVSYAKNGVWQGPAHSIPQAGSTKEDALHPHLLLRNCQAAILVNQPFPLPGLTPSPSLPAQPAGLAPDESYEPWICAVQGGRGHAAQAQAPHPSECELIVMVGLPGSGKTTWAQRHMQDNPEKRYMLLGPELALDQMRLLGLRKASHHHDPQGTVDHSLVLDSYLGLATAVLKQLMARAAEVPRNYILDQTNLSAAKRAATVAPFLKAGFQVKAALAAPPIEWLHFMQEGSRHAWGNSRAMPEKTMAELMANYFEVPWPHRQEGFSDVMLVHTQQLRPPARKLAEEAQDMMGLTVEERLQLVEEQVVQPQRELARKWLEKHRQQASREEEERQQQEQQDQQQDATPQEPTPPGVHAQQPSFPPSPPIFPSSSPLPQHIPQQSLLQQSHPPAFTATAAAPSNGPTLFPPQPPFMPMPMAPTSNPTPSPPSQAQPPMQQQQPTSVYMPPISFPLSATQQQPQILHPEPPQQPQQPGRAAPHSFSQPLHQPPIPQPQPPIPPPFSFPQPPLQPQVPFPQPPQQTLLQATQPIPPAPPQNSFPFFSAWL